MYKVLYVPDDQRFPVEIRQVDSLEDLKWMVGGDVDEIHDTRWQHYTWQAYIRDADRDGMKYNSRATFLARTMGWHPTRLVYGGAVFVGPGKPEPDGSFITDVEPVVIAEAVLLGMKILTEEQAEVQQVGLWTP